MGQRREAEAAQRRERAQQRREAEAAQRRERAQQRPRDVNDAGPDPERGAWPEAIRTLRAADETAVEVSAGS